MYGVYYQKKNDEDCLTQYYVTRKTDDDYLVHYGIPGMKWGHRKTRVQTGSSRLRSGYRMDAKAAKQAYRQQKKAYKSDYKQKKEAYKQTDEYKAEVKAKRKKAVKVGAAAAGTALAVYGAYKLNKYVKDKNMKIAYENGHREVQKQIDMMSNLQREALSSPGVKSYSYDINPNNIINRNLNRARNDSFRTAAKNVMNYRKTGGDYGFRYSGVTSSRR